MFKPVLAVHVAAGAIALCAMWVPLVARKGGSAHRRAGWVFVFAMAVVAVTALALAGARWFFDPRPAAHLMAVFLLYVAVLTSAAVSSGVRVLRFKERTGVHRYWWDLGMAALLTFSSIGVAAFGVVQRQPLFIAFSLIGMINGPASLRYWLRPPAGRMHWWFAHMNGMLGGCIAAVTAFVVVNAGNLRLPQLVAWLAPPAIGSIAAAAWRRHYQRRFNGHAAPRGTSRSAPAGARDTLARSV